MYSRLDTVADRIHDHLVDVVRQWADDDVRRSQDHVHLEQRRITVQPRQELAQVEQD